MQTLSNDDSIKASIPPETDSLALTQDCPVDTKLVCPSCRKTRKERQDACTLSFFLRRGNTSPTKRDFEEKRADFTGKDAHCVLPQTVIKRETKRLTADYLKERGLNPDPCVLVQEGTWSQFAEFYKKGMIEACSKTPKESTVRDRVQAMRKESVQAKEQFAELPGKWKTAESLAEAPLAEVRHGSGGFSDFSRFAGGKYLCLQ
jgi:hypothetical protein